jgi:hypothetical protein
VLNATMVARSWVEVRRWRRQGPVRRPGVWNPAGVVDSRVLADAMAMLIREETGAEARVVTGYELLHKVRAEDRERILDQLNGRTTADIRRDLELRSAAAARLTGRPERRSGHDRRLGRDRRARHSAVPAQGERRLGEDRRSGGDRCREHSHA